MRHLLDTDACVRWLRGDTRVALRIVRAGIDTIAVASATQCELYYGAAKSGHPMHNADAVTRALARVRVLPTDKRVAREFGANKAGLGTAGRRLDDFDLLIAATALAHDLTLVTGNERHFRRIEGLRIENWLR